MTSIKTDIPLQESLFEAIETLAREMQVSHQQLFVLALEEYVQRHQNERLLEQINAAYADAPEPEEAERLRKVGHQHRKIVEGTW